MSAEQKKDFPERVATYYKQLKQLYLTKVSEAENKKYAQAYYHTLYFEKNIKLPQNSFFFDALSRILLHEYQINSTEAIFRVMDELYTIRSKSRIIADTIVAEYMDSHPSSMDYIESEKIEEEYYLLSLDITELAELLALFIAVKQLKQEFPKDETMALFSLDMPVKALDNIKLIEENATLFTESQQILALHFLFESLGIVARKDYSLSAYTRFAHLLSRKPITRIENSPKHSMVKRLLNYKNEHPSIKDLQTILPYFQDMRLDKIVEEIEKEIRYKEKNS